MEIGSAPWLQRIDLGARELGIQPQAHHLRQCARFAQLLAQANRRVNLTAITEPGEMALKHFVDSLAPLAHIPQNAAVADLGSGAGFPGLVLALFRPDIQLASIESVRKKTAFQQHAALELKLANVKIYNIRAEKWLEQGEAGVFFDVVVCRALADLDAILAWAAPMLKQGGRVIAMKGKKAGEEITAIQGRQYGGRAFEARELPYSLPIEKAARSLVILSPIR